MEVRDLLNEYEFPGDDIPFVIGSALKALDGDEEYVQKIVDLAEQLDTYIPEPERDLDKPFLMPVEDVFSITGRGTVATGRIEQGIVHTGDEVEVVTPEEYMGDVIGDLNRRRGRVHGMEPRGNAQVVTAHVPLSEMFGYATDLRSNTQGRATYTMQFERYDEVPPNIAEQIVEHRAGEPVPA